MIDSSSDKENIPPAKKDDDDFFDFANSSFKYDNEYLTDESYKYSTDDSKDESFVSDSISIDSSDDEHPMNFGTLDSDSEKSK